jgi:hypothetical protein
MRVLLDNDPVAIETAPEQPLRAVIDSVQAIITQRRRVVQEVLVDGQTVPADQVEQWLARPAGQVAVVEFKTACPRRLARDTLAAVAAMLADTSRLQQGAADKLAAGQTGKALELLLGCLNHFRLAEGAVRQAVQVAKLDLEQVKVGQKPVGAVIQDLAGQLTQVKVALETRDYAMLGDLLNYELPKVADAWKSIVVELERQLGE